MNHSTISDTLPSPASLGQHPQRRRKPQDAQNTARRDRMPQKLRHGEKRSRTPAQPQTVTTPPRVSQPANASRSHQKPPGSRTARIPAGNDTIPPKHRNAAEGRTEATDAKPAPGRTRHPAQITGQEQPQNSNMRGFINMHKMSPHIL